MAESETTLRPATRGILGTGWSPFSRTTALGRLVRIKLAIFALLVLSVVLVVGLRHVRWPFNQYPQLIERSEAFIKRYGIASDEDLAIQDKADFTPAI